ncbi:MAG: NfeD family protein [Candidatus Heteroscillospira sp.]|jgi:membrane protein implicated in regulation of membrane protease activity
MNFIWAAAIVVFVIAEAATVGLVSIWFAVGALGALIVSVLGGHLWLQIAVFAILTAVTLVLTRPLVSKYVNNRSQPTNADRLIGCKCIVTDTIDNLRAAGTVSANGKFWTARSDDGSVIEKNSLVTVERIEGVKLIVSASSDAAVK